MCYLFLKFQVTLHKLSPNESIFDSTFFILNLIYNMNQKDKSSLNSTPKEWIKT